MNFNLFSVPIPTMCKEQWRFPNQYGGPVDYPLFPIFYNSEVSLARRTKWRTMHYIDAYVLERWGDRNISRCLCITYSELVSNLQHRFNNKMITHRWSHCISLDQTFSVTITYQFVRAVVLNIRIIQFNLH